MKHIMTNNKISVWHFLEIFHAFQRKYSIQSTGNVKCISGNAFYHIYILLTFAHHSELNSLYSTVIFSSSNQSSPQFDHPHSSKEYPLRDSENRSFPLFQVSKTCNFLKELFSKYNYFGDNASFGEEKIVLGFPGSGFSRVTSEEADRMSRDHQGEKIYHEKRRKASADVLIKIFAYRSVEWSHGQT